MKPEDEDDYAYEDYLEAQDREATDVEYDRIADNYERGIYDTND